MDKVHCERCRVAVFPHQLITIEPGSIRPAEHICHDCNNQSLAQRIGINYIPLRTKTLTIPDASKTEHLFSLTQLIHGTGIGIIAEEITEHDTPGYRFSVHGEANEQQIELLERLTHKLKKHLSIQYIRQHKFGGRTIQVMNGFALVGRVVTEISADSHSLPIFIIDGKSYTWADVGQLIKKFDGFQFKLHFADMTDDLLS